VPVLLTTIAVALLGAGGPAGAAAPGATGGRASYPGSTPRLPAGARFVAPLAAGRLLRFDVVLQVPNPAALASFVTGVSNPGSPNYRQYLQPGEFASRFGPAPESIAAVRRWLSAQGLSPGPTTPDGLIVPVSGTVAQVSGAFHTSVDAVRLAGGSLSYSPTGPPSVPASLGPVVQGVVGLSTTAPWRNDLRRAPGRGTSPGAGGRSGPRASSGPKALARPASAGPQACPQAASQAAAGGPLTMNQLAGAYDFSPLYAQGRLGAGVTIGLYELEPFDSSDVALFDSCYGISTSVSTVSVDGGAGSGPGSGEAILDVEDAAAFAPDASVLVYEGPNDNDNLPGGGPFDTLDRMATDDRAQVLSTSWGNCEPENTPAGAGPGSAAGAESQVFAEMAAQGQTMVAASGDSGSEGCFDPFVIPPDLDESLQAIDPASQQDVTAVGGTSLPDGSPTGETVWNDCAGTSSDFCALSGGGSGGGGISANWPMPSWQAGAGRGVINPHSSGTPCGATGGYCRQVPDVAADADPSTGVVVYSATAYQPSCSGWCVVGGTSAAAPMWGAIFALADAGCSTQVGMANPALYSLGTAASPAFNDVTVPGTNDLTQTNSGDYPTTPGYDLATGWGSPNVANLVAALQPPGGCPLVTGLSASSGPVGGGETLTVFGNSLAEATAVDFNPGTPATILADSANSVTVTVPGVSQPRVVNVTVTTPEGTSAVVPASQFIYGTTRTGLGYWLDASDGGIFAFGNAQFYGSMGGRPLNKPVVGMAATADDRGYWEVASDGGLFAFGDAQFYGSMGGRPLNKPIVAIAPTPDGQGYWEVASDGGLFAFGDAQFYGSMGGRPLNKPIVGLAATLDSGGYWEVASDGGLFAFGDAGFYGSTGGMALNEPVVGMASIPTSRGYWEVASDGGMFSFGDAQFLGSTGSLHLVAPIVGMANT